MQLSVNIIVSKANMIKELKTDSEWSPWQSNSYLITATPLYKTKGVEGT